MSDQGLKFKAELSGLERQELCKAIINAYPEESDLKQVIDFKLEEKLNVIAGGKNYQEVVFNLIKWAQSKGKIDKLIEALAHENPGNKQLTEIKNKLLVDDLNGSDKNINNNLLVNPPDSNESNTGIPKIKPKFLKIKPAIYIPWGLLLKAFMSSSSLTLLVLIIRLFSGIFEPSELWFYDQMMRWKVKESPDDRLVIVEVTPDDIKAYGRGGSQDKKNADNIPRYGASLPDKVIYQILNELLKKNAAVIGLDIYRDFKAYDSDLAALFKNPEKIQRLIFICKIPDESSNNDGYNPPDDVPEEQVGFSDFLFDSDGVLRRQILQMKATKNENSQCGNSVNKENQNNEFMDSFAFKIAQKYLESTQNKKFVDQNGNLTYEQKVVLKPLNVAEQGGYSLKGYSQKRTFDAYQVLLNYRNVQNPNNKSYKDSTKDSPLNIAKRITVKDILSGKIPEINNKIVLIGVTTESYDSISPTPFSTGGSVPQMWGVYIQAQKVSQIISAAIDNPSRSLLTVWSLESEIVWFISWGVIGAIIFQLYKDKEPKQLIIAIAISILCLYGSCLIVFISHKIWLPFTPTVVVFVSSGGILLLIKNSSLNRNKQPNN